MSESDHSEDEDVGASEEAADGQVSEIISEERGHGEKVLAEQPQNHGVDKSTSRQCRHLLVDIDHGLIKLEQIPSWNDYQKYLAKRGFVQNEVCTHPGPDQVIRIVISPEAKTDNYHSNAAINKMEELAKLKGEKKNMDCLLVYCGIVRESRAEPQAEPTAYSLDFQSHNKFNAMHAAFKLGTHEQLNEFFKALISCSQQWSANKGIGPILCEMLRNNQVDRVHSLQSDQNKFLGVSISMELDDRSWTNFDETIVYRNCHQPLRPRALVLYDSDGNMQQDSNKLLATFNHIGYSSERRCLKQATEFRSEIETFASESGHGDSCILVILTQLHSVSDCYEWIKPIENNKNMEGKPRLVLLHMYEKVEVHGETNTDELPDNSAANDALEIGRNMHEKFEPQETMHQQSGMIIVHSTTNFSKIKECSPYVNALCTVFRSNASQSDVISMLSMTNAKVSETPNVSLASWTMQLKRKFYLADTSDKVPMSTDTVKEKKEKLKSAIAAVITDRHVDGARNYQMFLEAVGFEVHAETTKDVDEVYKIVQNIVKRKALNIFLVVPGKETTWNLKTIIDKGLQGVEECRSTLLIYCGFHQPDLPDNLPGKLSVAYLNNANANANASGALVSLLKTPKKNWKESSVAGRAFESGKDEEPEDGFWLFKSSDDNPVWRTIKLKTCVYGHFENVFEPDITKLRTPPDGEREEATVWPSAPGDSIREKPRRALIIHNVVFRGNAQQARYASRNDCQRLTDTMATLGYRVSAKSNLSKVQFIEAIEEFSKDHMSVALFVMSHGMLNAVNCTDGIVEEADWLDKITSGNGSQPRLVIIQSCRNPRDKTDNTPAHVAFKSSGPLVVGHSTSPEDSSSLLRRHGSRFIRSVCATLAKYGKEEDVLTMATRINYIMCSLSPGPAQQPWWFVRGIKAAFKLCDSNK